MPDNDRKTTELDRVLFTILGCTSENEKSRARLAAREINYNAPRILHRPVFRAAEVRKELEKVKRKVIILLKTVDNLPSNSRAYLEADALGTDVAAAISAIDQRLSEALDLIPPDRGGPTPHAHLGLFVVAMQKIYERATGERATFSASTKTELPDSRFYDFLAEVLRIYWPTSTEIPWPTVQQTVRRIVGSKIQPKGS